MTRKPSKGIIFLLAVGISLQGLDLFSPAQGAVAQGQTAKAALVTARAVAKQWQADAVPFQIAALGAREDGTAIPEFGWAFFFHSAKANNTYSIQTPNGQPTGFEGGPHFTRAIPDDFIDSDRVMAEAKKNGFKAQGKFGMLLAVVSDVNLNHGLYWYVVEDKLDGARFYVDPKTGKFLGKRGGK